jgi:hypothetical protein
MKLLIHEWLVLKTLQGYFDYLTWNGQKWCFNKSVHKNDANEIKKRIVW